MFATETIVSEAHVDDHDYYVKAVRGEYVSSDLTTGNAVSSYVGGVKTELDDKITAVDEKVEDIHDADDSDIDSWFDF